MRTQISLGLVLTICLFSLSVGAQTNTFTYQGRLTDNNFPANTTYEMQFKLFDSSIGGFQLPQPTPITLTFTAAGSNAVSVVNGAFTVPLDFGAGVFTGADRWLEISVRKPTDPPGFTMLTPRQPITSSPYAIRSSSATTSDSTPANGLTGITLASGVTGSSLTSVGALMNLTINGTLRMGLSSAEPTGTNGLLYYNTTSNKFRCFENNAWVNCIAAQVIAKPAQSQQPALEALQQRIKQQQAEIDGLKKLLCLQNPQVEICKQEVRK